MMLVKNDIGVFLFLTQKVNYWPVFSKLYIYMYNNNHVNHHLDSVVDLKCYRYIIS